MLFVLGEEINKRHYVDEPEELFLIHGDFHHQNILSSERDGWLTIDTKGVIGSPAYDVVVYLYNPAEFLVRAGVQKLTERRIEIFSEELGMSKRKIIDWGISQAILASIWMLEDHGRGWVDTMSFAGMLEGKSEIGRFQQTYLIFLLSSLL